MDSGDAEIMRLVQAGQTHRFDELATRYRPALVRVALSKLGEIEWAEDAAQEALLAAFAARDCYNPRFAFRTWLWTILLNVCRRQWQRRVERLSRLARSGADAAPTSHEPTTHESGLAVLLRTERRDRVHEMLARLPEAQADAIRLRFLAELSFAEIALAMDSSVSGAKQRVKQGLLALAALLGEHAGET